MKHNGMESCLRGKDEGGRVVKFGGWEKKIPPTQIISKGKEETKEDEFSIENGKVRYPLRSIKFCHRCGAGVRREWKWDNRVMKNLINRICGDCGWTAGGTMKAEVLIPVDELKFCPVTGVKSIIKRGREALGEVKSQN